MSGNDEFDDGEIIEEEVLVGKWDCDNCDTLGNDGDSYDCSGCGAPRSEDVQFYLGDSPRLVTDEAGIAHAHRHLPAGRYQHSLTPAPKSRFTRTLWRRGQPYVVIPNDCCTSLPSLLLNTDSDG